MERVKDTKKDFSEYVREINDLIEEYTEKQRIEDIRKISQKEYNAILMYVGMHLFPKKYSGDGMGKSSAPLDDGAFLCQLCDFYIFLASSHDKVVNLYGYSYLLNISINTLYSWSRKEDSLVYNNNIRAGDRFLTSAKFEIVKKLMLKTNEENRENGNQ